MDASRFLRMIGRTSDLFLIAPRFCSEAKNLVEGFMAVYGDTMPFRVILKELSDEQRIMMGAIEVQAFSVIHRGSTKLHDVGKRVPAVGYSIGYDKQRIVISGDTGICQSLKKFVKVADLAILEATVKEKTAKNFEVPLSLEEARESGKTAKKFILIHQWH